MTEEQVGFNLAGLRKLRKSSSYIDYTRIYSDQQNSAKKCGKHRVTMDTFTIQFSSEVVDFTSQYGSDISISYTANNITGRPSNFPNYGDFPQSYVMVSARHCRVHITRVLTSVWFEFISRYDARQRSFRHVTFSSRFFSVLSFVRKLISIQTIVVVVIWTKIVVGTAIVGENMYTRTTLWLFDYYYLRRKLLALLKGIILFL